MNHVVTSSGQLGVGTTTVQAHPCAITAIILNPGAANSTITVYDNASAASGTILAQLYATTPGPSASIDFTHPINALNGITVVIAGTGTVASVNYARTY